MVRIKLKTKRYLISFLLTLSIFIIGLFVGLYFNQERISYIEDLAFNQKLDYDSMQLQYAYVELIGEENSCLALSKTLETSILSLEDTRIKIEKYSQDFNLDDDKYISLKRQYILAELKYWLLAKKTKEICNRSEVSLIYFYSNEDCDDCSGQSYILTYLKEFFGNELLVFSIDESFDEEPMVSILKNVYNIKNYPTLIIGDKKLEGLVEKDDLNKLICFELKNSELCNGD